MGVGRAEIRTKPLHISFQYVDGDPPYLLVAHDSPRAVQLVRGIEWLKNGHYSGETVGYALPRQLAGDSSSNDAATEVMQIVTLQRKAEGSDRSSQRWCYWAEIDGRNPQDAPVEVKTMFSMRYFRDTAAAAMLQSMLGGVHEVWLFVHAYGTLSSKWKCSVPQSARDDICLVPVEGDVATRDIVEYRTFLESVRDAFAEGMDKIQLLFDRFREVAEQDHGNILQVNVTYDHSTSRFTFDDRDLRNRHTDFAVRH